MPAKAHSGFIMIIVLGLLGVMAMIAVSFAKKGQQSQHLVKINESKTRARLIARSGYEAAVAQIYGATNGMPSSLANTVIVNPGTISSGGDIAVISADDSGGQINVNDGIIAGMLELGAAYESNTLESTGPLMFMENLFQVSTLLNSPQYPDEYLSWNLMAPPPKLADFQPGDTIGGGISFPPFFEMVNWLGRSDRYAHKSAFYSPTSYFSRHSVTRDGTWGTITGPLIHYRPTENRSGLINQRIRTILNCYGDIHRFQADIGVPDPATAPSLTKFEITDSTTFDRGQFLPGHVTLDPTALGDIIVKARPLNGYKNIKQLSTLLNDWGDEHLSLAYLDNRKFFDMVKDDLTVESFIDRSVVRCVTECGVYSNETRHSYINVATTEKASLVDLSQHAPRLANIWAPHATAPININAASHEVRSAVYAAINNVSYIVQSSLTLYPQGTTVSSNHRMPSTRLGTSGPVLKSILENGIVDESQKNRFMSFRDAQLLSLAHKDYLDNQNSIFDFDDFKMFLKWYSAKPGVQYERADSSYSADPLTGGHFTEDYVEETLPIILSGIRRIPGFLGAPQALLSLYKETDAQMPNGDPGRYSPTPGWGQGAPGMQRRVEDFVRRSHHPLIEFLPTGTFRIGVTSYLLNVKNRAIGSAKINTSVEVYSKKTYRTQADFLSITDSGETDAEILIGPSLINAMPAQSADSYLGFVGMNPNPISVSGNPQIAMDFGGNFVPVAGKNPPQDSTTDPFVSSFTSFELDDFTNSNLEDTNQPMFANGAEGCDLSPFGGILLSSIDHGPLGDDTFDTFSDSIYWRLQNASPNAIINSGVAPGKNLNKGQVKLWVRIPSGYHIPSNIQRSFFNATSYTSTRFVRVVWSLVFWQKIVNTWRPSALFLLHSVDPTTGKHSFIARVQVDPNANVSSTLEYGNKISYPITDYVNDSSLPIQDDLISVDPNSSGYSTWISNSVRCLEKTLTLTNEPESKDGAWHHVTVGWDFSHAANGSDWVTPYDNKLWIDLGASSCVDGSVTASTNTSRRMTLAHPTMDFRLGEYGTTSRNQSHNSTNLWNGMSSRDDKYWYPLYRLDSCVDNVQAQFGSPGVGGPVPDRYNITAQPKWVIDPGLAGKSGYRVLRVGARIFNPKDSKSSTAAGGNHPRVKIWVARNITTGSTYTETSTSSNGHNSFYSQPELRNNSRFVLQYMNENPKGNGLIQGGSDNWTEIPWIQEVSWHIAEPRHPQILEWESD